MVVGYADSGRDRALKGLGERWTMMMGQSGMMMQTGPKSAGPHRSGSSDVCQKRTMGVR